MIGKLKQEYNKLIEIHDKAALYLDDPSIPSVDKDKKAPMFEKILNRLNEILMLLDKQGIAVSSMEISEGFKEVN